MKKHLIFKEFMRLSREEQNTRYKELSEHDKFLARMSDVGADVGNRNSKPLFKEEILKIARMLHEDLRNYGNLEDKSKPLIVSLKSGNSFVNIYKPHCKSRILVGSFFIGCREISNTYEDYVKIEKIN